MYVPNIVIFALSTQSLSSCRIVRSDGSSQIYMTPDDFFRCITRGILQPQGKVCAPDGEGDNAGWHEHIKPTGSNGFAVGLKYLCLSVHSPLLCAMYRLSLR